MESYTAFKFACEKYLHLLEGGWDLSYSTLVSNRMIIWGWPPGKGKVLVSVLVILNATEVAFEKAN